MSYKRSRTTFEEDQHAPFAVFGTPLPDESEARDDGSFVPVWKQEVRDERGRKRLHGAFTGGFSAGYFNTVGSKEGWTPSTFVSSRSNRRNNGPDAAPAAQRRAEDYMDEEDLADAAEAQKLQTSQSFAGLGSTSRDEVRAAGLMGLFRPQGDTMGVKLLRRMGWRDGQGIGPKVRRSARLDVGSTASSNAPNDTHLFAPDDVKMIQFIRKTDQKGLGHQSDGKLSRMQEASNGAESDDDAMEDNRASNPLFETGSSRPKPDRSGIGVGILNDDGSDEEDHFAIGPRIKYNKVIGGDKKKKKKKSAAAAAAANPALRNAPVFVPKTARSGNRLRRCHDGRLPLDGFILAEKADDLAMLLSKYAPPVVPLDWKSSKDPSRESKQSTYLSAADAAKASKLDPKARAQILGEKALPGKSVFDFLSSATRDKLVAASGRTDFPAAKGEIPEGLTQSEEEKQTDIWRQVSKLDRETALAAIARSSAGPYADNEGKRARYRAYLENQADSSQPPPTKPVAMRDADFIKEMNEFHNCAQIFKPMTGFMASRFTTAKTAASPSGSGEVGGTGAELLSQPEPKMADPAEEAAKMGMFGKMTRSMEDFYPTRLLCKRFNVKPPAHSRADGGEQQDNAAKPAAAANDAWRSFEYGATASTAAVPGETTARGTVGVGGAIEAPPVEVTSGSVSSAATPGEGAATRPATEAVVDSERNDAVEGKTAHADVLRAIFGDSDSE